MVFRRKNRGSVGLPLHNKEYAGAFACSNPSLVRDGLWGIPLLRRGEAL